MNTGIRLGRWVLLVFLHLVLFLGGAALFGPDAAVEDPAQGTAAVVGAVAVAVLDTTLLAAWITRSRHRGLRLWAETVLLFYGIKTFSSTLEVWWFVGERWVPKELLPHLFAMTLPLALLWSAAASWALGPQTAEASGRALRSGLDLGLRVVLAGAVLYPVLFFAFGYGVAWQADVVRAYYDGPAVPLPPLQHFEQLFATDPGVLPFEMLRGLLWIAIGWPMIRATRGPWWIGGLLFAASMAVIQNDVHLLPNPLMPSGVRGWHLLETSTSNFVFGLVASWLIAWPVVQHARPPVAGSTPVGSTTPGGAPAGDGTVPATRPVARCA